MFNAPAVNRVGDVGFDAKIGLTPSLTLDATYNTDFAQVEVDDEQINLDRFRLFFPEKRPFFLENAGTFSVGTPQSVEMLYVASSVGGVRLMGYRSPAGFQRWVFPRVGAELTVPFSGIAGQVYASGTTLVAGTSNTVLVPDTGVHVRAGVTGGGSRLSFFAEYHLERLRFDVGRQEQWGEVSFGLRISP